MEDPYELQRFVTAQDSSGTYLGAISDLRAGRKMSHWMWFVFPQVAGLGHSPTSKMYAIRSLAEARAYLDHRVLGPRLRKSAHTVAEIKGRTAQQIMGGIDAQKLHSSVTLFLRAAPEEPVFQQVLNQYFEGLPDARY